VAGKLNSNLAPRRRLGILALFAIAAVSAGIYQLGSGVPECHDAAPSAGLTPALLDHTQASLATTPTPLPQLPEHGPVGLHNRLNDPQCCLVIAHAGGGIDGVAYTNSREALETNYSVGRRIFEIDFAETCDGSLVLLHDWERTGGERLSKARFLKTKSEDGLIRLDLNDLTRWLLDNPDATIVTDTKGDFDQFFQRLKERLPSWFIERHFVIQVYDLATLDGLQKAWPKLRLVLTVYKMKNVSDDVLSQRLADGGVIGLTIPLDRALGSLPTLREHLPDLPIYVHGPPSRINALELHAQLEELGASGLYLE
jgi:glycerophosphoryl diester phosphodiesterase